MNCNYLSKTALFFAFFVLALSLGFPEQIIPVSEQIVPEEDASTLQDSLKLLQAQAKDVPEPESSDFCKTEQTALAKLKVELHQRRTVAQAATEDLDKAKDGKSAVKVVAKKINRFLYDKSGELSTMDTLARLMKFHKEMPDLDDPDKLEKLIENESRACDPTDEMYDGEEGEQTCKDDVEDVRDYVVKNMPKVVKLQEYMEENPPKYATKTESLKYVLDTHLQVAKYNRKGWEVKAADKRKLIEDCDAGKPGAILASGYSVSCVRWPEEKVKALQSLKELEGYGQSESQLVHDAKNELAQFEDVPTGRDALFNKYTEIDDMLASLLRKQHSTVRAFDNVGNKIALVKVQLQRHQC